MTRRQILQSAVAPALLAQSRKRNIVFILTDDHRFDFLSCAGHPWVKTPNLDRLAQHGLYYENAFVTSSLCSPSRASILTGVYPHTHKVQDNFTPLDPRLPSFPALLQKNGYKTAFLGKWHMGGASDEPRPGFDHWVSFEGQGQYFDCPLNINGQRGTTAGYITDALTVEAEKFIAGQSGPFMMYLSHKAVHSPFQPAPRHKNLYAGEKMPRPESMWYREDWYEQKPEWIRRRRLTRHGVDGAIGQSMPLEDLYMGYARCLAAIDESTGRVMDALQKKGMLNDTLIVYMGDNGYLWGEHGLIDKRSMHEPSLRVPLLMHCPDLFAAGRRKQFALNIDIGPTFLDVAGVKPPASMHGQSLLPVMRSEQAPSRQEFLYEYEWERDFPATPTVYGLRTDRYSLMQYYGIWDLDELYDIQNDPQQMKNLVGKYKLLPHQRTRLAMRIDDPALKKLVDGLQGRMEELLKATGGDPRFAGREIPGAAAAL